MKFSELLNPDHLDAVVNDPDQPVNHFIFDSRSYIPQRNDLFVAIKGDHHDGHTFIAEMFARGIRQFVVESGLEDLENKLVDSNILLVNNSIDFLQQLACRHRSKYKLPVVGITGSNGKTIVKEWLAKMIGIKHQVIKSPGSYNSQLGVPLSVLRISSDHDLGIFEAGISREGEMSTLQAIIAPTVGILTNVGTAHDTGFADRRSKIAEKLKLFSSSNTIIYRSDDEELSDILKALFSDSKKNLLHWSTHDTDGIFAHFEGHRLKLTLDGSNTEFVLPLSDESSRENLTHGIVTALHLGMTPEEIQIGLHGITHLQMRLEMKKGRFDCYIVDDSYSNDLDGLNNALSFMTGLKLWKQKSLILSPITQIRDVKRSYKRVIERIQQAGIARTILVGTEFKELGGIFPKSFVQVDHAKKIINNLEDFGFRNEVILIKGARKDSLENLVQVLTEKVSSTRLEINLAALEENLNQFRSMLKPETKLMVMVKAFAYGAGNVEIGHLLQYHGVDYLGVAYTDEGVGLRENGITLPIMVMNAESGHMDQIIEYNLEVEIYSLPQLVEVDEFARKTGKSVSIHIKLESGMHRLGLEHSELDLVVGLLASNPQLEVKGVMSHLASADHSDDDPFTRSQIDKFNNGFDQLSQALSFSPTRHLLNTSGIIRFPEYQFEMVRLGIGLHGINPTNKTEVTLSPVSTFKTIISQKKNLNKGDVIGYGTQTKSQHDGFSIGILAAGYADGIPRGLGNGKGGVWCKGRKLPFVGNICMDMSMVDLSNVDVDVGDEVEIFGPNLGLEEVAVDAATIPYEILTGVGARVQRIFKYG